VAWYADGWGRRVPITIHNSAGTTTPDVALQLPQDWDEFWDSVDASGAEVRVTAANGITLLDYEFISFNQSTRSATLVIDEYPAPGNAADEICLAWLYWDNSGAADGSTATTITSAESAEIDLGLPVWLRQAAAPPRPGQTRPRRVVGKDSQEQIHVYVDATDALAVRRSAYAGRVAWEEPWSAEVGAVDSGGTSAPSLVDADQCRWVEAWRGSRRRIYLKHYVKAGSSGTNYTITARVRTRVPALGTPHKLIALDTGVRVVDVQET